MDELLPREKAEADFQQWLDLKKISDTKRRESESSANTIIEALMNGGLVLGEDGVLTQKLKFPIEDNKGNPTYSTLEFKPRVKVENIHAHLQGVKSADADGRVAAMIAAVTSKSKAIVLKMDTEDYSIGQAIVVFFL